MHPKCLKRCIVVQFVIAAALVTAIVSAFFIQKSTKNKTIENSNLDNATAPYYDDDQSPIVIDVNGKETDGGFVDSAEEPMLKDDDFISTIELPEEHTEITPRLDIESNETSTEASEGVMTLRDAIGKLPKAYLVNNAPADVPSLQSSLLPSDGPSIQEGLHQSESSQIKTNPSFDVLIANFVDSLHEEASMLGNDLNCPLTHEYSTACSDTMVDQECYYDFVYTGCSWASLSCSPMVECKCENGMWSCKNNVLEPCNLRRSRGLPTMGQACNPEDHLAGNVLDSALSLVKIPKPLGELSSGSPSTTPTEEDVPLSEWAVLSNETPSIVPSESPSIVPSESSSALPSDGPSLFSGSPSILPSDGPSLLSNSPSTSSMKLLELSSECPLQPNFGECSGYQNGLHCDFDYVYTGCTWDVLQCSPAIQCDCSEGMWKCEMDFTEPCEVTINGHPPGGVPWGVECDPSEPIVIPDDIEKLKDCPDKLAFGSCVDYEEDLRCEYNHAYKGCTWDEFMCAPSITCDCKQNSWECFGDFENPCKADNGSSSIPEGFPWGKACDPSKDGELQQLLNGLSDAPSSAPTNAPTPEEPEDKLSDECPSTFRYGECFEEYVDDLYCPYNYAYTGCTWEELACEPSIQCKCDHWFGQWECKSRFENCNENGSSVIPVVGLPWGKACDPTAELPSPPL